MRENKVKWQVFISSRSVELEKERDAVEYAIYELWNNEDLPFAVWRWESAKEIPSGKHPDEVQSKGVRDSDIYVLILGSEYGDFEYGKSPTHKEYDIACSKFEANCILIYIKKEKEVGEREEKLEQWIDVIKGEHTFKPFKNSDQLKDLVKTRLRDRVFSKQKFTISWYPEDPPDVADFVNRDAEQNNLEDLIRRQRKHMIIIQGIAGIGKTQIAAKLMENIKNSYITYWKEIHSVDNFDLITKDLAGFLRDNNDSELADYLERGGTDHENIINILLNNLKEKQYALFFDNYQAVENKEVHDLFKRFKDKVTNSTIIITNRRPPPFVNLADKIRNKAKEENIEGFDIEAIKEYLKCHKVKVSQEQLVKIDQKTGGHLLHLALFAGSSSEMETYERVENLPESIEEYFYDEIYISLADGERNVLKTLSVFRTAVMADACIQVSKTDNVREILLNLIKKLLVKRKKELYYLHDSIREFSYNLIDNPKEYHKRAGEYCSKLEKTPENILETTYHMIKDVGVINKEIIEYLMDTPSDRYTDLIILDVLGNNTIESPLVFDLINKILVTDNSHIRFIAVETMVENANLGVDMALEILERIVKDKNGTESVRKKSIGSLSTLMELRFEKVVNILGEIVDSGNTESLRYVCHALKDAGIKNEKTVHILKQISAYDLGKATTDCKKLALDILYDWKVLDTSLEINYLYKLRKMDSSQAIEYVEDLMFGSNQFNRFNVNYFFFAWVLGELYRVKKIESANLMKKLIENVSGTIETPWIVSRVLLSKKGIQYDTIRDFIASKNILVRMSGFLVIFQTYNCLNFFQRKYTIQDIHFEKTYESVKYDSIKLLELLTVDKDDLLREMAKMMLQEISHPSEHQKLKVTQTVVGGAIKGFLKVVSPDMLVKFVKATNTGEDLRTYYMTGVLALLSWTQVNPEKVYPILKVQNAYNDMTAHIISLYYNEIRNSPKSMLDIMTKFGFESSEYLTRIGTVNTSHTLILPIPEKILGIYESLLLNPIYQDRRSKVALLYALSLMRKWFTFIEDYKTEHNSEIDSTVCRADELIQRLTQDEDDEVSMLADLVLNGIRFT